MVTKTRYYGIYIVEDRGHYWIATWDYGDRYCGTKRPTSAQIDDFRSNLKF